MCVGGSIRGEFFAARGGGLLWLLFVHVYPRESHALFRRSIPRLCVQSDLDRFLRGLAAGRNLRGGTVRWWKGSPNFLLRVRGPNARVRDRHVVYEPLFRKILHQSQVGNLKPKSFDGRNIPNLESGMGGIKGTEWDGGRSGMLVGSDSVEKIG